MSEPRAFNGKDFIEGDWTTDDVSDEASYAYNRWRVAQQREAIAAQAKGQERFDSMTLDQITDEYKQKLAEQEAAQRPEREYWAARQAMAERVDYIPTPKNAQRIEEYVRAAKLDSANPDHILQAMQALDSRGLLQIDPSKIEVKPRARHTEEDLYEMPWSELEKLARKSNL